MANNYIAKIRAELDSGSLQEQINKIVKNSGTIKIKVEADGDISGFIKDISKKVESAGNVSIKPKVDVSEIDSSFGTLSKKISTIVDGSVKSVQEIYKSVGDGFDTTVSRIDGDTKKVTQDYESYVKRALTEEQKMQEALASTLKKRREEEEKIQRAQASAINKSQEESYRESLKIQEALVEMIEKRKKEEEDLQRAQDSAINKSQEEIYKKINSELEKSYSYISKMQEGTQSRLILERELSRLSSGDITSERLQRVEQFTNLTEERLAKEKEEISTASKINTELNKSLSYIIKMQEGTEDRLSLEKKLDEISSKRPTQESLEEARKLTREAELQLSYEKNRLSISEQIANELKKSSDIMLNIPSGYSGLSGLKEKFEDIQTSPDTEETLQTAKHLTQEMQEQLQYSTKLLELEKRQREEVEKNEEKRASAINKNQESLYRSINSELEKTSSYITKMKEGTSERVELEKRLKELSSSGVSEDILLRAKQLTAEAKEKLEVEEKELSTQEQIDNKIKEIKTRMEAVRMSSSQRLEIEKKIEDAMAMENSEDRLNALKRIKEEIAAMGKNAMSLGAMLQTAYEKFANKLRLCTEMCIEKQCVYAGKS